MDVLLEDDDPLQRSWAHLQLGQQAAERSEYPQAVWHFRVAAELDPASRAPRQALASLGETPSPFPRRQQKQGVLGRLLKSLR